MCEAYSVFIKHDLKVVGVVPCHIKDLCPFQGLIPPSNSESDSYDQSAESGIPIALGPTLLNDTPDTTRLDADDPSTDVSSSEDDIPVILPWRNTRQKRLAWSCTV